MTDLGETKVDAGENGRSAGAGGGRIEVAVALLAFGLAVYLIAVCIAVGGPISNAVRATLDPEAAFLQSGDRVNFFRTLREIVVATPGILERTLVFALTAWTLMAFRRIYAGRTGSIEVVAAAACAFLLYEPSMSRLAEAPGGLFAPADLLGTFRDRGALTVFSFSVVFCGLLPATVVVFVREVVARFRGRRA